MFSWDTKSCYVLCCFAPSSALLCNVLLAPSSALLYFVLLRTCFTRSMSCCCSLTMLSSSSFADHRFGKRCRSYVRPHVLREQKPMCGRVLLQGCVDGGDTSEDVAVLGRFAVGLACVVATVACLVKKIVSVLRPPKLTVCPWQESCNPTRKRSQQLTAHVCVFGPQQEVSLWSCTCWKVCYKGSFVREL
jgi:hypothetical protein